MTDTNPTVVVEQPAHTKPSLWSRINKPKVAKAATITGGVLLVALWLKKKLSGSSSVCVDATAHVETADQSDEN